MRLWIQKDKGNIDKNMNINNKKSINNNIRLWK